MTHIKKNLAGKKLLLLSGGPLMCQIVKIAQSMGIYVVVTDFYTDLHMSPAKQIADEYWNISWNDTDALEKQCVKSGIDGVFTGFSEFCVIAARKLCDRLGKPFYATIDQIEITRNKALFKSICRNNGVQVVDDYVLSTEPTIEDIRNLKFPLVVKPADNAGSRGISVCYNETELRAGIRKALSFSDSKTFVTERYMNCPEVNISYTIQNGFISLSCMSDAIAGSQNHGQIKLTDGWVFPSRYLKEYIALSDNKVRKMLHSLKIQNGFLFITAFYDNGVFRLFEMGFRLGGGTTYNFISINNKINYVKMMLAHSLTGKMDGWDVQEYDNPFFKIYCCNLTIMAKPGIVGHVGDMNLLRELKGIISIDQFYDIGQEVPNSGALNQTFARVNIVADTAYELAELIQNIYNVIDLKDVKGEDMILSRIKKEYITDYWKNI